MKRLIAALACRATSSRLYGKPLQSLVTGRTILDQILDTIECLPVIECIVLGVSEGLENSAFVDIAKRRHIDYIVGDETDVLGRLIKCGRLVGATDIFRVTTECPFLYFQAVEGAWRDHVERGNDVTVVDGVPLGTAFEIYSLDALVTSHVRGDERHQSEYCSLYIREHRSDFQVEVIQPEQACARMDIRLTVDYPEDLVICRRVYENFEDRAPLIPLGEIIAFLDDNPSLKELVAPYSTAHPLWL